MTHGNTIEAKFIPGKKGQLFALHRPPQNITQDSECFVLAAPFAEEMNRCRYMCTMLGQRIPQYGHGYLSVDSYGTGDSAGDFVEADWDTWCEDLIAACQYAKELGYRRISLFAIRLGAQLAMEVAENIDSLQRIVLWQPVISGKTALTQFLRIRIAASLERDEQGGSVADFEQQIEDGNALQVAGYDVSPGLFRGIQGAHLDQHLDFNSVPIAWFNTLASEDRTTPRVELNFLEKWRAKGAQIQHTTVIGPSYWAVHDRTLAPTLVDATVHYIAGIE